MIFDMQEHNELTQEDRARLCQKTPASARERTIFSSGNDGEAGDIGCISDGAGSSQAEKGPVEARPSSLAQLNQMRQINRALGLFICFFGAVVLISIGFTETTLGKQTNLGAGLILLVIGLIMIVRSRGGPKSS